MDPDVSVRHVFRLSTELTEQNLVQMNKCHRVRSERLCQALAPCRVSAKCHGNTLLRSCPGVHVDSGSQLPTFLLNVITHPPVPTLGDNCLERVFPTSFKHHRVQRLSSSWQDIGVCPEGSGEGFAGRLNKNTPRRTGAHFLLAPPMCRAREQLQVAPVQEPALGSWLFPVKSGASGVVQRPGLGDSCWVRTAAQPSWLSDLGQPHRPRSRKPGETLKTPPEGQGDGVPSHLQSCVPVPEHRRRWKTRTLSRNRCAQH